MPVYIIAVEEAKAEIVRLSSHYGRSLAAIYKSNSMEKKRQSVPERVGWVEDASFTPMIMSSAGGMGS